MMLHSERSDLAQAWQTGIGMDSRKGIDIDQPANFGYCESLLRDGDSSEHAELFQAYLYVALGKASQGARDGVASAKEPGHV